MDATRYRRLKELFLEAAGLPRTARGEFIRTSCGDDADMREQLETLLDYHLEPESAEQEEDSSQE